MVVKEFLCYREERNYMMVQEKKEKVFLYENETGEEATGTGNFIWRDTKLENNEIWNRMRIFLTHGLVRTGAFLNLRWAQGRDFKNTTLLK